MRALLARLVPIVPIVWMASIAACGRETSSADAPTTEWRLATHTPYPPKLAVDAAFDLYLWAPGFSFPAGALPRRDGHALAAESSLVKLAPAGEVLWSLASIAGVEVEAVAPVDAATTIVVLVRASAASTILGAAVSNGRSLVTVDTNANAIESVVSVDFGDLADPSLVASGTDRLVVAGACIAGGGSAGCSVAPGGSFTPYGSADIVFGVVQRDGAGVWQHELGTLDARTLVLLQGPKVTPSGTIVIAAPSTATLALDRVRVGTHPLQAFHGTFAADGAPLDLHTYDGSGSSKVLGLAMADDGSFAVSGNAYGDVDLGAGLITGTSYDFFDGYAASGAFELTVHDATISGGLLTSSGDRWIVARASSAEAGAVARLTLEGWSKRFDVHTTKPIDVFIAQSLAMEPAPDGDVYLAAVDASQAPLVARMSP